MKNYSAKINWIKIQLDEIGKKNLKRWELFLVMTL